MAKTTVPIELSSTPSIVDNGNATAITIDSSENVGIGTSPSGRLHINSNGLSNGIIIEGNDNDNVKLKFDNNGTGGEEWQIQVGQQGASNTGFHIRSNTASANRFSIDSSGNITTPNQPMFFAGGLASTSYTQGNAIVFNTERFDRGGNYNTSNGIFTAPVTGIYHFDVTLLITGASSSYLYDMQLYTSNQSYYAQSRNQYSSGSTGWNDNYLAHTGSWTVDMDAGDTAYVKYNPFDGGGIWTDTAWTHFSGYLVG